MSIVPSASASTSRQPVVLGAERRRHLEEGAVVADVVLVQRQMRDRGAGGDAVAGELGAAKRGDGRLAGDLRRVVAPAGQPREADVAVEHDGLRLARDAGKAEPRRRLAFVHDAAVARSASSTWWHDQRVEVARIGEGVAHHLGALSASGGRR